MPPPLVPPSDGAWERYYLQDNPVIPVPLAHLQAGDNSFEGTCAHENEGGWGQWGLYSLILRVYYDQSAMQSLTGRIASPASGATFGENPVISIDAKSQNGVARIDVLAWYEGYDVGGNGAWLDWHGGAFQVTRGGVAELREHVGTLTRLPYELTWDTRWVPDQKPGALALLARIQDSQGLWYVTQPVTGLTLARSGESVRLYPPVDLSPGFGVRVGRVKSCTLPIPEDHDLSKAVEAAFHYRTWHGWDGHHQPWRLNNLVRPNLGKNHHYDYDVHLLPPSVLKNGDNVFTITSDTEHHMLEVLWPGPAITVRYRYAEGIPEAESR